MIAQLNGSISPVLGLLPLRPGIGFVISVIQALQKVVRVRGRLRGEGRISEQEGEAVDDRLDSWFRWDGFQSRRQGVIE